MALKTSEASAKAGPGDLLGGDPGSDRRKAPRKQPRGTLARTIYKRRRHGRVHVSVEPASRIEGLNRVFDDDALANAHAVWMKAEYGWPYVDEGATEPLRQDVRHLAVPQVHLVVRADGIVLVGVSPRPRGAQPPKEFLNDAGATLYAQRLAEKHGSPSTGPLEIVVS